jgi:hypothetical protein
MDPETAKKRVAAYCVLVVQYTALTSAGHAGFILKEHVRSHGCMQWLYSRRWVKQFSK